MESGLLSGVRRNPFYATQGEYATGPARQIIRPEHDDDSAILIQAPSRDWGMRSPYGSGQALVLFAADNRYASSPATDSYAAQRVLFRIDSLGGVGLNGMHLATGRNIQPNAGGQTQHAWIDGAYADLIGTVMTQHAASAKEPMMYQSSTGQTLWKLDPSQNNTMLAPDAVGRSIGVMNTSGSTVVAAMTASDSGLFGVRMQSAAVTPGTIALSSQGAAAQTAKVKTTTNSAGQNIDYVDSSYNHVCAAPDSVGRSFGTSSNSGATAGILAASDGGFTGARAILWTIAPATAGLVILGAASQSASLQVWQSSTGANLSAADTSGSHWVGSPDGSPRTVRTIDGSGNDAAVLYSGPGNLGARALIVARGAGLIPLALQMSATPTADAQEWQSSTSAVLTKVDPAGNVILNTPGFLRVMDTGAHEAVSISGGAGGAGNARIISYADQSGNTNRMPLALVAAATQTANLLTLYSSSFGVYFQFTSDGHPMWGAGYESTGAGAAALGANCPAVTPGAPYKWLQVKANDGSLMYIPAWK